MGEVVIAGTIRAQQLGLERVGRSPRPKTSETSINVIKSLGERRLIS